MREWIDIMNEQEAIIPDHLQALIKDGHIQVWRMIKAYSGFVNDLYPGTGVGQCWSYKKDFAIAYDGSRGGHFYRLHALMPVSSVDWRQTIELDGSQEYEIRALSGKPVKLIDIDWTDELGDVFEANVAPDRTGVVLSTGAWV